MRLRSSEYRRCGNRPSTPAELLTAALLLSIIGVGLGPTPSTAQETEVAYVEDVSGRVIATTQGKPTLLDALDLIGDRTRLDLQASSEARICHHVTQRLFELKGPLRAAVSREGVTVESGKAAPAGSCAAPVVSIFHGGVALRSAGVKTIEVPLRPGIKVVDHSTRPSGASPSGMASSGRFWPLSTTIRRGRSSMTTDPMSSSSSEAMAMNSS